MTNELRLLVLTAASLGFVHTVLGPDHYLPFTVLAKARKWSISKTAVITCLCGAGHVLSSVVLEFIVAPPAETRAAITRDDRHFFAAQPSDMPTGSPCYIRLDIDTVDMAFRSDQVSHEGGIPACSRTNLKNLHTRFDLELL